MDAKPRVHPPGSTDPNTPSPDWTNGRIEFRNVRFSYPESPALLRNISFKVPSSRVVAIVGTGSSGKSTIISLIMRFLAMDGGDIDIDRAPINNWQVPRLRSSIGLVEQDAPLFGATIAECIRYGNETHGDTGAATYITDDEVSAAIEAVGLSDWIRLLPDGINAKMSGVEIMMTAEKRQQLAIARALVRKPKVLLLDDATRSMAIPTEQLVLQGVRNYTPSTSLCPRVNGCRNNHHHHMFSDIRSAQRGPHPYATVSKLMCVVVLHQGEIVEVGKHFDLLAKHGLYYSMAMKQIITMGVSTDVVTSDAWSYVWNIGRRYVGTGTQPLVP
jgi:ABC-type multidrug transport system fused ATPase/permease subunit